MFPRSCSMGLDVLYAIDMKKLAESERVRVFGEVWTCFRFSGAGEVIGIGIFRVCGFS